MYVQQAGAEGAMVGNTGYEDRIREEVNYI